MTNSVKPQMILIAGPYGAGTNDNPLIMNNPRVNLLKTEILSDNWYTLRKVTYQWQLKNGAWQTQSREAYDRGNGATILLYNKARQTVILINQFRLPTYVNGNPSGMLIEACAGLLDQDNPEQCIQREVQEETGYRVSHVRKIFESYMSPGSVTELLHFFVAEYEAHDKTAHGGGVEEEEIDVLELPFGEALKMVEQGEIKDGKTILLLQYAQVHGLLGA